MNIRNQLAGFIHNFVLFFQLVLVLEQLSELLHLGDFEIVSCFHHVFGGRRGHLFFNLSYKACGLNRVNF